MNTPSKDLITQTLQEILAENPTFLCFTNHSRLNILSWKSKKVSHAKILKIGDQRFIGFTRKDRNGEDYWKYQPLTENSNSESEKDNSSHQVDKFQQRQEKTKDYAKQSNNTVESSINQQSN